MGHICTTNLNELFTSSYRTEPNTSNFTRLSNNAHYTIVFYFEYLQKASIFQIKKNYRKY
jgi:hypothetical protein